MGYRPAGIEVGLFFSGSVALDFDLLMQSLATSPGLHEAVPLRRNGGHVLALGCLGYTITLTWAARSLPLEGFKDALASPYIRHNFADACAAVSAHTCALHIDVEAGDPVAERRSHNGARRHISADGYERMLVIAADLVREVARIVQPAAVHWGPSGLLLDLPRFLDRAKGHPPVALSLHPHLFSSGRGRDGVTSIGFRSAGLKPLIGQEVLFHEAPVAIDRLLEATWRFTALVLSRGSLPPAGDCLHLPGLGAVRLHPVKAPWTSPGGYLELSVGSASKAAPLVATRSEGLHLAAVS